MGLDLRGLLNTAAGAAPFARQAMLDRQRRDEDEKNRLMRSFYDMRANQRADNQDLLNYQLGNANLDRINAETTRLRAPIPEKPGEYDIVETENGLQRVPKLGKPGAILDENGQPIRKLKPPTAQQHVVDPVTGEVKFFDPTKPPQGMKVNPAPKAPPQPSYTPFQGTDPTTGAPVVRPFNTKTGQFGPAADVAPKGAASVGGKPLAAPLAAKVGQAGEMIKKASDILPMIDGMRVSLSQSAAADVASHGIGIAGLHVPGTKGLGNAMLNRTPAYAQYQAALQPFILAAAHALSGARINQDQVEQIRKSIEIAPGDVNNPQVVEQKRKNMLDLINSISGSLPAEAMAAQDAQIDAKTLTALEGYGYKRAKVAAPNGSTGNIDLRTPSAPSKPAGTPKGDYGIFTPPSDEDEE